VQDLRFHRPASARAALDALRAAPGGRFLAGGQSLIPLLKLELAAPGDLVSIAHLAELQGVRSEPGRLVIGAATSHASVAESDAVRHTLPALAALAGGIGDAQVRNRGTLGGSIAHADPAADYPAALVALDARIVTDRRELAADEFFRGIYETALEAGELIREVRFPLPDRAGWAKFPQPASKFALAGVFVAQSSAGTRLAATGVGPRPLRVRAFEDALARDFRPAALEKLSLPAAGLTDNRDASAEYRAHLVGVMARRAVAAALGT
jgi:carbon-monoxide dehydrogenase medium subunit